jgi:hypothetical protein
LCLTDKEGRSRQLVYVVQRRDQLSPNLLGDVAVPASGSAVIASKQSIDARRVTVFGSGFAVLSGEATMPVHVWSVRHRRVAHRRVRVSCVGPAIALIGGCVAFLGRVISTVRLEPLHRAVIEMILRLRTTRHSA